MLYYTSDNVMKKTLDSEAAMITFGVQLGRLLRGGEFIELSGDIGAGKTTFTKGLAKGMGISDTIQSPTFTISRIYDAESGLQLAHYDFYRLDDAGIMADELHDTASSEDVVTVIEWGDIIRKVMPADYLELQFNSPSEDERILSAASAWTKKQGNTRATFMILLLDTSTPTCKLTLVESDKPIYDEWVADRQLAKGLLEYLKTQLAAQSKTWDDLTGIGVFQGPGSFTGLAHRHHRFKHHCRYQAHSNCW